MVGAAPLQSEEKMDPRVYVFGNDYHWRFAGEPVDNPYNQVDRVSMDKDALFGPSMAFALATLDHAPQTVIGLIPCAKSSSTIIQWQRNLSDHSLYGSCLKRIRAASQMGQISGILFFQGEADAIDPAKYPELEANPANWSELFTSFVLDIREDLNKPDLPVIFAQIGSTTATEAFTHWEVVKEQQASTHLSMTAMITTDDLPLLDGLHFTRESYQNIGERFSEAYWNLERLQNSNE
jgi:hypothetical protein